MTARLTWPISPHYWRGPGDALAVHLRSAQRWPINVKAIGRAVSKTLSRLRKVQLFRYLIKHACALRAPQHHPVVVATMLFLVALTGFSIAIEVWSRKAACDNELLQNSMAVENVAYAAEEHVEGTLNTVSWTLDGIIERIEHDGLDASMADRLRAYLPTRVQKPESPLQSLSVTKLFRRCRYIQKSKSDWTHVYLLQEDVARRCSFRASAAA